MVSITHVAVSSLSHEVCREVTAFFSPSDGNGGGRGEPRGLPSGQAGRASRCLRAWGCIARLKDRRIGGHSAEPPTPPPRTGDFDACISSPPQPPAAAAAPMDLAASPGKRDLSQQRPFLMRNCPTPPEPFPMGVAGCSGGSRSSCWPWETLPSPCLGGGWRGRINPPAHPEPGAAARRGQVGCRMDLSRSARRRGSTRGFPCWSQEPASTGLGREGSTCAWEVEGMPGARPAGHKVEAALEWATVCPG